MTAPVDISRATYMALRAELLKQMPELEDDPECLLDTLDGISDFQDKLAAIARSAASDEAMLEGLTQYQVKLADRRAALKDRSERKRRLVLHYMEDAGIKKITKPDITVSRRALPPSVIITDDKLLPDRLMRRQWVVEPDKKAIKEALQKGEQVMGATLSNGGETLSVKI